jgi:CubicO group peptidase (beta-lactamase class C family)
MLRVKRHWRWYRGPTGVATWLATSSALASLASCSGGEGPPAELQAPLALADGWEVATPVSVGLDDAGLASVASAVAREEFGHVHALLVARHGALVFERYFHEYDGAAPHTLQSVTKSLTSALIGIAVGRGEIASLDITLGDLFPDYGEVFGAVPQKAAIRLRDLLSMRSGLAWDESAPFSDDSNDAGALSRSDDWIRYALEKPLDGVPGETWTYNSGATILLSAALLRSTGSDAVEYATEQLFEPMGFGTFVWYRNPVDGLPHAGGGLRLLPRDLARFGQRTVARWRRDESATSVEHLVRVPVRL